MVKVCANQHIDKRIRSVPGNNGRPVNISAIIQPTDQTSTVKVTQSLYI